MHTNVYNKVVFQDRNSVSGCNCWMKVLPWFVSSVFDKVSAYTCIF